MAKFFTVALVAAVTSVASAAVCQNLTIPVSIAARNGVFNVHNPTNNIESIEFSLNDSRQGHNYTMEALAGYNTVSGNYEIAASYCHPDKGPSNVVQVLTHGIGFDRSYWDFPLNNYNYSYVHEAVDQYGYSTFAYDRLGIGMSTHFTDPINEGQIWLEVAALRNLTLGIRDGSLGIRDVEKIVHVGHSFGSSQTAALVAADPTISDGIVLTGFSQNATFAPFFILGSNFIIANTIPALSSYVTGYLAPATVQGAQIDFFAPGQFDPDVLAVAYATGQPATPGEILTLAGGGATLNPFAKPVLIVTGEHDVPYCGGDCLATSNPALASIPAASMPLFPNAQSFEAFIVPGAGHGLNLEYSHPLSYGTILNYLVQNGLGPGGKW